MVKSQLESRKLLIKNSPIHGYGVFADEDINKGDLIEECYALLRKGSDIEYNNYYFKLGDALALPLGNGCLYNHSLDPNANYEIDKENSLIIYTALRPIKMGEEIFITYGKNWFADRKMDHKEPSLRYKIKQYKPFSLLMLRFSIVTSAILTMVVLAARHS